MNNNDISKLIGMLNNIDNKQLENSVNQLNKILSNEDKQKIAQILNTQGKKGDD